MKKITLFLSAMLFSVMSFAGVITFTPGEFDALESSKFDVEKDGVTLSCSGGTITADQFRFFKSQTLTVSSTAGNITSIEFTCTAANETKHGPGGFGELEGYSYADKVGTWAGSAASVTFSATNNQVRATQVVVTIDGEGGGETPDTPVDPEEPDTPVDPENPGTPEEPETPVGSIDGYSKVTNAASLVAGDKVVLYCDDAQLGVTGWNGNKDATVAESGWVEYVVEVADGGFYLKDGEQYITGAESANHFKYGEKAVCGVDKDGVLACGTKFLYKNGDYYRMYTDKSSNSAYKPFYVYKAGEGGGETPDPENPENPDPENPDPENPDPENPEPENPTGTVTFDADVDKGNATETQAEYEVIKDGVTMTVSSGRLGTYNNEVHYRIYKNQTLTLTSTAGNIVKVEFTCTGNDDAQYGPGCFTASAGDYNYSGPVGTWTGSASEVVFTAATNQVRATQVVVTLGEGGGETPDPEDPEQPEEPGDVVKIEGLVYADAYYVEEEGFAYWDIQMYNIDEAGESYEMPIVFLGVEAKTNTALNGTYDLLEALYGTTLDEETYEVDGVWMDVETAGTLTIKNVNNEGDYSFMGSFVGEDGNTYEINTIASVWAIDDATGEDIELNEDGSDTPDTPDTPEGMITCAEAATIAAAENYKGTENVTVYGYVVELGNQKVDDKTGRNKQTFYMSDTKGGEQQFMAYWAFVPDFFEVGDKVAITGILQNYKGTIEIADGEAVLLNETGVDDVLVENTPVKVIKNAQMYIMQGNKVYTIMGTQVK